MVKVSVLVPVYNVEKYLGQCLDSILRQSLSDIEIICVNDGSTDGSLEILRRYAQKNGNIKIVDKLNGGLPSARNAGLDAASGEYVAFVDSDDLIQPRMLETLYKNAKKTGAEIVVCGANIFPETPRADGWVYSVLSPREKLYPKCDSGLMFENPAVRPFIWRTFVKRELIEREHIRLNEEIRIGEDNAFQFRVYPKANGISVIPDKLYNYRWRREGSMMNTAAYNDVNKKLPNHVRMVLHIAEEWKKSGDMEKMGAGFLKWSVEFLYGDFISLPLELRVSEGRRLVEAWTDCGCVRRRAELPTDASEKLEYFFKASRAEAVKPRLSVVMLLDKDRAELEKTLDEYLAPSMGGVELLIAVNARSALNDEIIYKYLRRDLRVRIIYAPDDGAHEARNKALRACAGEFVRFGGVAAPLPEGAEKYDLIAAEDGAELSECFLRREFIERNGICFGDYSIESETVFLSEVRLAEPRVLLDGSLCARRQRRYVGGLNSEDCAKVIRSFARRLELAAEKNCAALHNSVFAALSEDLCMELILGAVCSESESGSRTAAELMRLAGLFSPDMLPLEERRPLPLIYARLVDKLHKRIADISDIYRTI